MRRSCVWILALGLICMAGAVGAQDGPSLLPLPSVAPPPLPVRPYRQPAGPPPAARPGSFAPSAGQPHSIASTYARDDLHAPAFPPPASWGQPSESLPTPPPDDLFQQTRPPCSACAPGAPCAEGELLGGSPFAEALRGEGLPPVNLYGMQLRPGLWFGSLAGMVMTRDSANAVSTTYDSSNVNTNLLDTGQARMNWSGGGQVMVGRWFGQQTYGMQFVYWQVGTMTGNANVVSPAYQLSTPFNLGNVNIGQQSATFYYDNAHEHALWRKDGFSNFEWNALRRLALGGCGSRWLFTGIAGVRYFRFQDGLIFGAVNSNNFSDAGGAYAAYLNTNVTNSLVGFQLGTRVDYFVLPRVRLYAQPMVGFYGNQVTMREHLYSGDGAQGFDVFAARNTVSTLGQIDVGAGYQITPRFSAFAAYRLIGVSRVGLADNQIPAFWADQQGMSQLKTNGDLILHGVLMGGMWNF